MRTPSGVVNSTKLPPLGQGSNLQPTQEEPEPISRHPLHGALEYDMLSGEPREMDQDMGMEDEYGIERDNQMDMEQEEYDQELAD